MATGRTVCCCPLAPGITGICVSARSQLFGPERCRCPKACEGNGRSRVQHPRVDGTQGDLPPGKPAVLRIDFQAFGQNPETVWKRALSRVKRKAVRRAEKAGLTVSEEVGKSAIDAFCALTSTTLARHGAPMMPAALFKALIKELNARILVVRNRDGEALASLLWVRDGPIAWVPWSGSLPRVDVPGDLLFWRMIEQALNEGAGLVDFGRSPTGSGAYRFKRSFGATPVPVL